MPFLLALVHQDAVLIRDAGDTLADPLSGEPSAKLRRTSDPRIPFIRFATSPRTRLNQ